MLMTSDIQREIQEQENVKELHNAFLRLSSNRDFKMVITEGYLREYAITLTRELNGANDEETLHKLKGISALVQYFDNLKFAAEAAESNISDLTNLDEVHND